MRRPLMLILLSAGMLALAAVLLSAMPARAELVNVTVLHTNDTRGRIQSYYYRSTKPLGGYAKRAMFFQTKRPHTKMNWITLDAGNIFGYAPLSYYLQGEADAQLMSMLDYDGCGLGPMDFAIGRSELSARIGEGGIPFICANVLDEASGKYLGEPFKIVTFGKFRVGLLGLADPATPSKLPPDRTQGLEFRDPRMVAAEWIPQLKGQVDTVFILSTLTLAENIALAVAHPEVSVIVSGGQMAELQVPLKVDGTLIVQAGRWGAKVGLLKLTFESDPASAQGYRMRYFDEQLIPMDGAWVENTDYLNVIASYQERLSREQFALVIGSLGTDMPVTKINSFETNLGNLFADAVREATATDIALLEAGAFREGLKSGPITRGDLYKAYPGDSRIVEGTLTGKELASLLSQSAANVGQEGFLQVSGLSFGIYDRAAYSIRVRGLAIRPDAVYEVAVTERMAQGIEGLTGVHPLSARKLYPHLVRDVVGKFLAEHDGYTNELEERISYFAEKPIEEPLAEPEPPVEEPSGPEEAVEEEPAEEEPLPLEETAPGEYEVIAEEEVDVGLAPVPPEEPTEAAEPAEEAAEEPPPESAAPEKIVGELVGSTTVEMEGMTYDFSVREVKVEGQPAYEFTLVMRNSGESHKMLSFPTGQYYDFKVYKEDSLQWNYAYNRYFTQETDSLALEPGEEVTFQAYWDGATNNKVPLRENLYRFVAVVTTTPQQEVSFIALYTPLAI